MQQMLQAEDKAVLPRVLLVYAHPDDEAIAVGARMPRFADSLFVQVTDGAPLDNIDGARLGLSREQYRMAREAESAAAFRAGGLNEPRRACLGIPDKEAALCLRELVRSIEQLLVEEQAAVVFTHAYEGGHADHDACAFAVHTALEELERSGERTPLIVESPFYNAASGEYRAGRFLEHADAAEETLCALNEEEQERKRTVLAAFGSQAHVLKDFSVAEERYRIAPRYNFTQPPHPRPAYYERFIEGMTAARFCLLAAQVLRARDEVLACR